MGEREQVSVGELNQGGPVDPRFPTLLPTRIFKGSSDANPFHCCNVLIWERELFNFSNVLQLSLFCSILYQMTVKLYTVGCEGYQFSECMLRVKGPT